MVRSPHHDAYVLNLNYMYTLRQVFFEFTTTNKMSVTLFSIVVHCRMDTYIQNWPLQPIGEDYCPSFSHHLCCVLIIYINVDSERQIF